MAPSAIPVVDFQNYGLNVTDPKSVTSDVLETTAKEIYDAFSTIGFLYLINHGIEQRKPTQLSRDMGESNLATMSASAIPVVDFQKYELNVTDPKSVTSDVLETTAKEIYDAFSTIGFLYLINHGIEQRKSRRATMSASAIPVVDFKKYGLNVTDPKSVTSDVLETTAKGIYDAFSTIGFLYLINHGIEERKVDAMFSVSRSFFDQPVEEKKKSARVQADHGDHGWVALETESLNPERPVGDLKEAFNFTPGHDGLWPENPAEFKSTFVSFYDDCKQLTERILDVLSIGLKLQDRYYLRECHNLMGKKGGATTLRSLYYPALSGSVKPGQVRCGEHSDYGTITLLFQDDIGGLEVMNTDDMYVPAKPVPGAIVVNIGDMMQRWTADQLRGTKHRVLIPEAEVKKRQSRQSVAFFVNPNSDTLIKCLDGSDKYEPISCEDYLNYRFSLTF